MEGLKRLGAVYLIGVAVAVAGFFIVNPLLTDAIVPAVWQALDVLMVVALAIALAANYVHKQEESGGDPAGAVTRRYLEAHVAFYLTAAVTILFLHSWFSLLAEGFDSLEGNHQAWVIWAAVDVLLPLVVGVTGCRLWRATSAD